MNRKSIARIVMLLGAVLIIALFITPAAAQDAGFSETFDDPALPGWEHSPEVIVSAGALRIAPGNFAARLGAWGDFDLSLRLRYDAPGESEIHYHATDTGGYLLVFLPDRLILIRERGPGNEPTEMAAAGLEDLSESEWLDVRISVNGGAHTITVADSITLAAEDPDPILSGGLVFASHGERTTELDDVQLEAFEGAPGEPGDGGEPTGEEARPGEPGMPGDEGEPGAPEGGVIAPAPEEPQAEPAATPEPGALQQLFESLTASQANPLDLGDFAINLVLAVLASFVLSRVYVYWGSSLSNRRKFAANFTLVTVTTTFIILVVRSSVALSLGLVGALSIIRFRAAIKDPEELAYLFFAISLGIGLGDNQRMVTLLVLVVVIIVLGLGRLLRQSQADVNLNLSVTSRAPDKVDMAQVMAALEAHCSKLQLLRFDENEDALEMSFVVEFRHTSDLNQARAALLALSDKLEISFIDNRGIW